MLPAGRVIQIDVGQSLPAPTDPDHFASEFCPTVDHRFDHGVQSRDIAASREYAYALLCHLCLLIYLSSPHLSDSCLATSSQGNLILFTSNQDNNGSGSYLVYRPR